MDEVYGPGYRTSFSNFDFERACGETIFLALSNLPTSTCPVWQHLGS